MKILLFTKLSPLDGRSEERHGLPRIRWLWRNAGHRRPPRSVRPVVVIDRARGRARTPRGRRVLERISAGQSRSSVRPLPAPDEVVRCCAPAGRPPPPGVEVGRNFLPLTGCSPVEPYATNTISTSPEIVSDYWSRCVRRGSPAAIRPSHSARFLLVPGPLRSWLHPRRCECACRCDDRHGCLITPNGLVREVVPRVALLRRRGARGGDAVGRGGRDAGRPGGGARADGVLARLAHRGGTWSAARGERARTATIHDVSSSPNPREPRVPRLRGRQDRPLTVRT
jgi:hypothetical protein